MEQPTVSTPQKRKILISHAPSSIKRTRSVSLSVKVTHDMTADDGLGNPDLPIVPKNPKACLGDLPDELLLNIMTIMERDSGDKVLARLCLTDKRCKRIAEAVMYRNIYSSAGSHRHAKAAAIASNPLLSRHVREIGVMFGETPDPKEWPGEEVVDEKTNRDTFIKILANAHDVQRIYLTETLDQQCDGFLHRLVWLRILNSAVAQPVCAEFNRFSNLKCMEITSEHSLSVEELSCVFRLPSLESLTLQDVYQTTPFENWSVPDSSSSIRKLVLTDVMLDISAVTQMLLALKALQRFEYRHNTLCWEPLGAEGNPMSIWPEYSWKLLGDALRRHRDSLETVWAIDKSDRGILDLLYPDGREVNVLGSFRDFPKLIHCHIPMEAFLDSRTDEKDLSVYLPPQLEEFGTKITLADPEFMTSRASALASLQHVVGIRQVIVELEEYLPLRGLDLSCGLNVLRRADIEVQVDNGRKVIALDDLKQMEPMEPEEEDVSDEDEDEDHDEVGVQEGEDLEDAVGEDDANTEEVSMPDTTASSDGTFDSDSEDDEGEFWTYGFMGQSIHSAFRPFRLDECKMAWMSE